MYELAPLPYLYQDLEPYIDTHTMGLHYLKHQKNYLDKLNSLLRKNHYDYRYKIEEILYHIQEFPRQDQADILFNLEKLEGNTNKLSFNLVVPSTQESVSEYKINGEISVKNEDKKTSASGKVTFNYSENEVTLNLSSDTEYGENLFSRKDVSNFVSENDITVEEMSTIAVNLMTKLMNFRFFGLIYGMNELNDEVIDNSFYDSEVSV